MSWLRRLSNALHKERALSEIDREIAFHIAERAEELRREGLGDEEALRRARLQFGNSTAQREHIWEVDISRWLDTLLRNLRYACRTLIRTPAFTVTVVLTLALGIGANTAIFSAIDAVLLRPLPFPESDRLMSLSQVTVALGETSSSIVRLEEWSERTKTFSAVSHYVFEDVSDTTGGDTERVLRATVGPRFLEVVGIRPALGRGFRENEHRLGGPDIVLISDHYWRYRFNSDPSVLMRTVRMGNRSYSIVGVLPPAFDFPTKEVAWWVPQWVDAPWSQARGLNSYRGVARLKSGVTLDQARADLERVQAQLGIEHPKTDAQIRPRVVPLKDALVGRVSASLWLLFAAVTVLLLIACTNIAALLLSRGANRYQEVVIRYAIGGSRTSVALQLLTESAVLALAGSAAGVAVAIAISSGLRALAPTLPRLTEIGLNGRVLAYTGMTAVVVALLCGLIPAFRGTRTPELRLDGGRKLVSSRQPLQLLLVGVQVTLSVVLLASAGLLVRSLDALWSVNPGFDASHVLTFRISASFGEERDYNRTVQRINRTLDELAALPGIQASATAGVLPGLPNSVVLPFRIQELGESNAAAQNAEFRNVSPSYFDVMQIPIVEGELCRRPEDARGVTEVMVNRAFVERFVRGRSAIGLHLPGDSPDRIAGIVDNAREAGLDREPVPTIYACFSAPTPNQWFVVRTREAPQAAIAAIRARIRQLEPIRSVYESVPLKARIGDAYAQVRLRTIVLTVFAAAAISLACLGVYGTLSYQVSLRRREIGLRIALGASRAGILRQFFGHGLRIVVVATAVGLVLSVAFAQGFSGMLFEISPTDPSTLVGVIVLVLAVASIAAIVPAARAARVEPGGVLREE